MSTTSSGQPRARSSSFSNTGGASGSATAGDTKDLEKYVKHLFYKASQIVVQSRQVRMVKYTGNDRYSGDGYSGIDRFSGTKNPDDAI